MSNVSDDYDLAPFFESAVDMLCIANTDGYFKRINSAFCLVLGYESSYLLSRPFLEFVHPEDVRSTLGEIQKLSEGARTIYFENRYRCRDGSYKWLAWTCNPEARTGTLYAVARDITQQKQLEAAYAELRLSHQLILESADEGVYGLDLQGTATFVNPAATRMLGYEVSELLGQCQHYTAHHSRPNGEPYPLEECPIYQTCLQGKVSHVEDEVFWRKDGTSFPVEYTASPMVDEKGCVTGAVVTFRNITNRLQRHQANLEIAAMKAQEQELELSRRRVVETSESLRREIAQQLHGSVQNKLIVVQHRIQQLTEELDSAEAIRELGELRDIIADLVQNDVRGISHQLYPTVLRRGLIPAVISIAKWLEPSLKIEIDLSEGFREEEASNRDLIPLTQRLAAYRIIEDSLNNVIKHSGSDTALISLEIDEQQLRISVVDHGSGFDLEQEANGLGLSVIGDYASVAGGHLEIDSAPGHGTRITVQFPLKKDHAGNADSDLALQ